MATAAYDAVLEIIRDPLLLPTCPPWHLFLIVSLPHLFYIWVLTHARSTIAVAKLFHSEPVDWFAGVALVLNALQLGSIFLWGITSSRFTLTSISGNISLIRLALGIVMWGVGLVFKTTIFKAIGKRGVYYGSKFGHQIPWIDGFPFSVTAHPQYLGSSLVISATGLLLWDPVNPGHILLPAFWVLLYILTGIAEEGLCQSHDPKAPLPPDFDPFFDHQSRPLVSAEVARLIVWLPVVIVRFVSVLTLILVGGIVLRILEFRSRRTHGTPLSPAAVATTRWFASAVLFALGFSVKVAGKKFVNSVRKLSATEAVPYVVVANSLSYVDFLCLVSVHGPLGAIAPRSVLNFFLLGPLLRAWEPVEEEYAMPQIVSPRVRRSANGSTTPLLAFPEGCNTVGGCMVPFTQLSALHATAVVLPTVLAYDTANSFNLSWTPRYPLVCHIFLMMSAWKKEATVAVLEPVYPSPEATAEDVATAAQLRMSRALGWPIVTPAKGYVRGSSPMRTPPGKRRSGAERSPSPVREAPATTGRGRARARVPSKREEEEEQGAAADAALVSPSPARGRSRAKSLAGGGAGRAPASPSPPKARVTRSRKSTAAA